MVELLLNSRVEKHMTKKVVQVWLVKSHIAKFWVAWQPFSETGILTNTSPSLLQSKPIKSVIWILTQTKKEHSKSSVFFVTSFHFQQAFIDIAFSWQNIGIRKFRVQSWDPWVHLKLILNRIYERHRFHHLVLWSLRAKGRVVITSFFFLSFLPIMKLW